MAKDKSTAVRACFASTLIAIAQSDWPLALQLFRNLVQPADAVLRVLQPVRQRMPDVFAVRRVARSFDNIASKYVLQDDRLLGTQYVDRFIYSGLRDHFDELQPTVERMLRSRNPQVQEAGARLASVAALYHNNLEWLVREALNGNASQRLGVAKVASNNISDSNCRSWCEKHLLTLFNDADDEVRREASSCFHQLKNVSLEDYRDLISAFVESKAFETDSTSILFVLEESSEKLPGITATVCEKFLSRFGDEAKDIRTSRSADVHMNTKLLFRTYQQHQSNQWGEKCLGLIDQMCLEGLHDVERSLAEFER